MKKQIKMMIAILVMPMVFTCCKKEAGPKGDKGDKGEQGVQGNNGVAGIINVSLTANSWNWDNSTKIRTVQFNNISALSQNICQTGVVMVYENYNTTWYPLPEIISIPSINATYNMTFVFTENTILIENFLSNGSDPNPGTTNFRLVIIPQNMIKPGVNIKNYAEVKTAYNLKD